MKNDSDYNVRNTVDYDMHDNHHYPVIVEMYQHSSCLLRPKTNNIEICYGRKGMKKIMLAFLLSVFMITSVLSLSVDIGSDTNTQSYVPSYAYFNYSWSHFIIPGETITSPGDITKLEFNVSSSPSCVRNNQRVYMKLTQETTVSNNNISSPTISGYTQIYTGSVSWTGSGWQGIELTNPFAYDGASNLEIIWEDRSGNYEGNYPYFYSTYFPSASAYNYSDGSFPDSWGSSVDSYPNTRISWDESTEPEGPISEFPWTEGFEGPWRGSPAAPLGWTQISLIGNGPWASSNAFPHSGTRSAQAPYSGGYSEHLLITPNFDFNDSSAYELTFWLKGSTDVRTGLKVKIAADYTGAESFTDVLAHYVGGSNMPTTLSKQTILLEGYSGNQAIAFVLEDTYGSSFYIDDVTIEEMQEGTLVQVTPASHDFGQIFKGFAATKTFTIANNGSVAAEITEFIVPEGYTVESTEELPITLAIRSSFDVAVTFSSETEGVYAGNFRIKELDPLNPFIPIFHDIALTGTISLPPQGIVCVNPFPLTFPSTAVTGSTEYYGNYYSSTWITPQNSYLNGNETVYQFTLAESKALNGDIVTTGTGIGAFILQEEPNATNPAPVILSKTNSGTTLTYTNEVLAAGTYYLIISGNSLSQSLDYEINLTADELSLPGLASNPYPANGDTEVGKKGNLTWNEASFAEGYHVYFSTDPQFGDITAPITVISNSCAYSGNDDTTHYWKVVPYNALGQTEEGIITWSFTTRPSPFPNADIFFDGARSTSQNMPMHPYYGYTVTQSIYQQAELNIESSAINSISYLYNQHSNWSETIEIYMKHTTKDTFASGYDWETGDFTHVFSGTMSVNTEDPVVIINFDEPFIYNDTDNLVVLFYATQSGYQNNSAKFYNHPVEGNRSITFCSDGTNPHNNYPNISVSGTVYSYRPVTGFNYTELGEEPQFVVSVDALTFATQTVSTASNPQSLTVSNYGLANLNITDITITGANADQFELIDDNIYPISLGLAEEMLISVVYAPTSGGDHAAEIQFTDDLGRTNRLSFAPRQTTGGRDLNFVTLNGNCYDPTVYLLPFNEGFEENNTDWSTNIDGWTQVSERGSEAWTTNRSIFNHNRTPRTGSFNAVLKYDNIDWLMKSFYFTGGQSYSAELYARQSTAATAGASIGIYYGTEATIASMIDVTGQVDLADGDYQLVIGRFTPAESGIYNIGIKAIHTNSSGWFSIDDITIMESPTVPTAYLSATVLNFDTVDVNEFASREVLITNFGAGILNITNIEIDGINTDDFSFSIAEELPTGITGEQSLAITVVFAPSAGGLKEATLKITDDINRDVHSVTLRGQGFVHPLGLTCAHPLPLVFPAVNVTGDTANYGNNYSDYMITPSSYYLSGDDVVYQFTLADAMLLNGTITANQGYMGVFILEDEPNLANPVTTTYRHEAGPSSTINFQNVEIPAGTYYMIISTWASPQSIVYNINLTADPIIVDLEAPTDVAITSVESGLKITWTEVDNANSYLIWGCDTPEGNYGIEPLATVDALEYVYDGVENMKFFKIEASIEPVNPSNPAKGFRKKD